MTTRIGPQLPPHLSRAAEPKDNDVKPKVNTSIGPQLPPHLCKSTVDKDDLTGIGPQLPSHLRSCAKDVVVEEKQGTSASNSYGPSLPPGYLKNNNTEDNEYVTEGIGPRLPNNFKSAADDDNDDDEEDDIIGPALPSEALRHSNSSSVKSAFEARASAMKNKLTGNNAEDTELKRDTWMTELPPAISKNFGLGPRTFRTKAQDLGDRSVWTDTPADRERKRQEAKETEQPAKKKAKTKEPTAEELEMHASVEEYNQLNRPQSLLEMHRAKHEGQKSNTRQPFDRTRDLAFHRKDPNQIAQFIEGAKDMKEKFSAGSYSNKFL